MQSLDNHGFSTNIIIVLSSSRSYLHVLEHVDCRSLIIVDQCYRSGEGSKNDVWLYLKISMSLKYCFSQYCLPAGFRQIFHEVGTAQT